MVTEACVIKAPRGLSVFERYLSLWVILCIMAGIFLGKAAPEASTFLDGLAVYVNGAPVVSIPIAICLFFMMYPGQDRFRRSDPGRQKRQAGVAYPVH
jgi:ACR3 family arsenite transporter